MSVKELVGSHSTLAVDVEVIFKIKVEVYGKGKDYSGIFEFKPHDILDSLRYKVPFFKTFANRGHELLDKDSDLVFQDF